MFGKAIHEQVQKALRDGNFFSKIICFFLLNTGFSSRGIATLQCRNRAYRYVQRKYGKKLEKMYLESTGGSHLTGDSGKRNVWICWLQGIEEAPELVKRCMESVKKHLAGAEIHFITLDNMFQYVEYPQWVIDKWTKGIISNTELSNLLRMELLFRYGGLWLDSTVYLTGSIPEYFYYTDIFMYSMQQVGNEACSYNNWCIYAEKGHRFLRVMLDIHYEYWKKENKVRDYFLWHIFATLYVRSHSEDFAGMFHIFSAVPHMLSSVIFEPFHQEVWDEITRISSVHKLSNKYKLPDPLEGTYYSYILGNKQA